MGLVLKAEHRRMERLVALKVLSPKVTKSPEALRRFQREVKAAARLEHPNIVTAHDADEANGTHFLVMQYIDGTDLSSLVKKSGPLPVDQALDCILQAARGLQYAHEHGVIHRDIKPANLLLDRQGTVKILDMGLARLDTAGDQQDQLTGTGQIMGTVDYMAPEQAMDTKHVDARADVYSLGVTLWYLLTGRPLYAGETAVEKLMAHQTKPIPSLRSGCPAASPKLEAVFAKTVAKKAVDRYQTMQTLIADLEPCRCGTRAAPAVQAAVEEDARLGEFLREIVAPSRKHVKPARRASPAAAAVATKPVPASAADPDATMVLSGPHVGTEPQMEQLLPGGRMVTAAIRSIRRPPRRPWWQDWRLFATAGAGGLLLLLGVWVIVRDKGGKEVARVVVPEGGSVKVETAVESGRAGKEAPETTRRTRNAASVGAQAKALPSAESRAIQESGFVSIFDGKTLDGWRGIPNQSAFSPPFSSHMKMWWAITAGRPFFSLWRCS
jgi:tRNA A-37 threonylcarbamoyl transferase component Bud32